MGLFDRNKEPIILKESSSAKLQIEALSNLLLTAPVTVKPRIEQDIRNLEYGLIGENQILFELKNSHMPMYVLHDLFIEYKGLTAQIDFAVITEKFNFIIECKNLFGNIEITNNGDFIRTVSYGKQYQKEGIYSPITQNKRHLDLIKQIKAEGKSNVLTKALFEKIFDDFYKGIVVLANPKTVLNDRFAKKEVKEQVIRADQLIDYMKRINKNSKELASSDKDMRIMAEKLLALHQENPVDYLAKYQPKADEDTGLKDIPQPAAIEGEQMPIEKSGLYEALRRWRYQQAQKENLKPYYIFYNTTLDELVEKKPKTIEQLKQVKGLGDIKCQKYGDAILAVIRSCS